MKNNQTLVDGHIAEDVILRAVSTKKIVSPIIDVDSKNSLDRLSSSIFELYDKGISVSKISCLLKKCNIHVSVEEVSDYMQFHQIRRIRDLELIFKYRSIIPGSSARISFVEEALQCGIKNGNCLFLDYQPQVDMLSGAIVGAEALLRLRYRGEVIQPSEFIPIAELTSKIIPIGNWVIREAFKEAKRWQSLNLGSCGGIKIAVNVSPYNFTNELPDYIKNLLEEFDLSNDLVGLEITESALIEPHAVNVLKRLQCSGLHLSLDDFGTGFSCLAELQNLPVQTIKIDRAFVKRLGEKNGNAEALIEMIVNLAERLGMTTLAEGVETKEQLLSLQSLGCTIYQGYLFSKPVSAEDFINLF